MNVNSKKLEGILVISKMGVRIGRLASFEFDVNTGKLSAILVRPQGMVATLVGADLLIIWNNIISISEEKIIVSDTVTPVLATEFSAGSASI